VAEGGVRGTGALVKTGSGHATMKAKIKVDIESWKVLATRRRPGCHDEGPWHIIEPGLKSTL
jgi:hypothetical protein